MLTTRRGDVVALQLKMAHVVETPVRVVRDGRQLNSQSLVAPREMKDDARVVASQKIRAWEIT